MNKIDPKLYNITLALAGMFQAAALMRDLAQKGVVDETAFETIVNSIYQTNPKDVIAVYGGTEGLNTGFKEVMRLFSNDKANTDISLSRYIISMIHLERKLVKNPEMLKTLSRRINYSVSQAAYFSNTHPTVITSLADIYMSTLGTLRFKIQILGQAKYLHQEDIIKKIRVLLLAGVRSAVLWRQVGGKRWHLFLWREKITRMAKQLLN